jgi:betaine reductase complex component B subunit beta
MPMPVIDRVPIADAIQDLSKATIALVNSGGIVPVGNPDRIQSASATKWGKYDVSKEASLKAGEWETIHAGFDPSAANNNPNRIVPLDALRSLENDGRIGKVHEYIYSTVGTGTTQAEASRMGAEIAQQLLDANVSAVILTST